MLFQTFKKLILMKVILSHKEYETLESSFSSYEDSRLINQKTNNSIFFKFEQYQMI